MNRDPEVNAQGRVVCELCPTNHKNKESWRHHIRRSHPEDYEKWKAEGDTLREAKNAERGSTKRSKKKGDVMGDTDSAGVLATKDLEIKIMQEKLDKAEKALEAVANAHPSLAAALTHMDTGACASCTAYGNDYRESIIKQAFEKIEVTELAKLAVARKAIPDRITVAGG